MPPKRQIYLLDPQSLDPETIAVAFAKTSRSPQSFRQIAAELTAEKSAEFHERWVVGYGHASVAEHAVLHVAIENVSRLAVETIESGRLASYTEKSTRYQKWDMDAFYTPPELDEQPELQARYQATCRNLFETYRETLAPVRHDIEADFPRQDGESEAAWDRRIRSEYIDVCRFLLPASALANLGMTINARALEHTLRKMLSDPLAEVRQAGQEIKAAALDSIPTLLKYVDPQPYLVESRQQLAAWADRAQSAGWDDRAQTAELPAADWCRLVDYTAEGELRALAAALYRFGQGDYAQNLAYVQSLDATRQLELTQALLGGLARHDIPLRETEYATYLFDVLIDQGGYFELKRHRMMTQTPQPLTTRLGYATPRRMVSAGMEATYRAAMQQAAETYQALAAFNPSVAAYVVPNGYNRRVLLGGNLRSFDHFTSLRAAPNAHFSMRRLALRVAEQMRTATPLLARYLRSPQAETWQSVEANYFAAIA